jgi:hypothetical protein
VLTPDGTGDVHFGTDNTFDLGASAANRPATGYFGTSLVSPIFSSDAADPADSGVGRYANLELLAWEQAPAHADDIILTVNASEQFDFRVGATVRFQVLTNNDTICLGSLGDTCVNRSAAGVYLLSPTAGANPTASASLAYDSTANRWEMGINGTNYTIMGTATVDVLTNKDFDTEATGNTLTTKSKISIDAAACVAAVSVLNWDDAGTGDTSPIASCNDTGSIQKPSADFSGAAVNSFERTFRLPSDFASTEVVGVSLHYVSVAASPTGNVEWDLSTVCRGVGQTWDAAFNTAQTSTDAVAAQNVINDVTQGALTMTGCDGADDFTLKISRDGVNDTNNDLAKLLNVLVTIRRDQ